ncbi:MAG: hypothetical protein IKS00_02050 [Bacteroidales bacterium]|jgi:hypothetical protein|nr:hypothetical protein [Bacteroidales bacterium]
MKQILSIIVILLCSFAGYADGGDSYLFDDSGISAKFSVADSMAVAIDAENTSCAGFVAEVPSGVLVTSGMPGRMPTFLFTALVSAAGTYTLYGAGAGPIAVAIVYACKHGDRREVKLAIFGCLTGAAVGGLAKWLSVK